MKTEGNDYTAHGVGALKKRELFAALAMMNLQNVLLRESGAPLLQYLKELHPKGTPEETVIARCAVIQADALIAALNEEV